MALQFILGNLKVNKKKVIAKRLLEIKKENPQAIIYYLVPEHLKFDMETLLLNEIRTHNNTAEQAMIDIQVLSFTRLAWFMLPASNKKRKQLTNVGLSMLVRQLLQQHQEQLVVYRSQINYQGFVEKLLALFEELYEGRVEPKNLTDMELNVLGEEVNHNPNIEEQRMFEIALLYKSFIEAIQKEEIANYQNNLDLIDFLKQKESFPNHYIVIDHHYFFNAQQMALILELIATFKEVFITLPITEVELKQNNWLPMDQVTKNTYEQIESLLTSSNLKKKQNLTIYEPVHSYHTDIMQFADHFKGIAQNQKAKSPSNFSKSHHFFWQADTPQTEIKHISNQIHYLVSNHGVRYKDILIVARDMDRYQKIVQPYFDANNIPFFFDHTSRMDQHPLMLWIESVLNLKRYNWQLNDLIYVLKSDLFYPIDWNKDESVEQTEQSIRQYQHQKNHLENIILANGYIGRRFNQHKFEWRFPQSQLQFVNADGIVSSQTQGDMSDQLRQWIITKVIDPLKQWDKDWKGEQAVQWFYQLLEKAGIRDRLIYLRDQAIEIGDIGLSRQHEQVWQVLVATLDEFHQLYKDVEVDFKTFYELIKTGLNEGSYHIIPPTMDQVTITNMASPQVSPYKICFVIGANNQVLPLYQEENSLLTTDNRKNIQANLDYHQFITEQSARSNQLEYLLIYQLLLQATDQLYISYATNVGEQTVELSIYLQQVRKAFGLETVSFNTQQDLAQQEVLHTSEIGRYSMQLSPILQTVRHAFNQEKPLNKNIIQLIQFYHHYQVSAGEKLFRSIPDLLRAMLFSNQLPNRIKVETAKALYGEHLSLSVSKLEQYYMDPYSHFLNYGLKLVEREVYELSPAKTGDYMHEFLDQLMTAINENSSKLADLSDVEFQRFIQNVLKQMQDDERFNLLHSQPRFQAVQQQLNRTLIQYLKIFQLQQRRIPYEIVQTEAVFGLSQTNRLLDSFEYHLEDGSRLSISGKIDRIDQIKVRNQSPYIQVVDYKSGSKKFDLVNVYYGLDLQILTYLNVALANYPNYKPLGAFYQSLKGEFNKGNSDTWINRSNEAAVIEELIKVNRLNGFLTIDSNDLETIEPLITENKSSQMYSAKLKKDGNFDSYSQNISEYDYHNLSQYVHYLIKQAGNQILQGNIAFQPFKDERYTLSMQPNYRTITGFDATQNYAAYRHKTVDKKEVLALISEIIESQLTEGGDSDATNSD